MIGADHHKTGDKMTKIESEEKVVNQSPKGAFEFLSDFRNFEHLMPPQVVDWQATEEECVFTIKGMATLGMKMESKIPYSEIDITKNGKAPFDFTLNCFIKEEGINQSKIKLVLNADLNPFLKMMAVNPLQNFLNMLVNKYAEIQK
jgi:carbon monoxide dehydrogenase subunit G